LNPLGGVRVGFSRDGSTLITTGDDTTQVWSVQNHQSLFDLPFSLDAGLTPDGQRIVANYAGTLGSFTCDVCGGLNQLLANAKRDVTRGFTPAERAQYLQQG